MNEHDGVTHRTALFEGVTEGQVVVILQTHTAEHDDINLCLQCDTRKQLVVRLSGDGEDRELLALYESVEHIDHRNTGTDHVLRNYSLRRVEGWSADIDHVFGQGRTIVSRYAGTVKDTAEQML